VRRTRVRVPSNAIAVKPAWANVASMRKDLT
jgi:hypothetical protein